MVIWRYMIRTSVILLNQTLPRQDRQRISRMHQDLAELTGIGPKGVPDVSTIINDILYGENGLSQSDKIS